MKINPDYLIGLPKFFSLYPEDLNLMGSSVRKQVEDLGSLLTRVIDELGLLMAKNEETGKSYGTLRTRNGFISYFTEKRDPTSFQKLKFHLFIGEKPEPVNVYQVIWLAFNNNPDYHSVTFLIDSSKKEIKEDKFRFKVVNKDGSITSGSVNQYGHPIEINLNKLTLRFKPQL